MDTTTSRPHGAPKLRKPRLADFQVSLASGVRDFLSAPVMGLFFASFFVVAGLLMAWITYLTGQTFWLVLAVMGFPLVGAFAAVGFYEISRRRYENEPLSFRDVVRDVWSYHSSQLPWLAAIIIVIFLFWFFLGHMIFALFLGLSPMTNVSTSLEVYLSQQGLLMIAFGTVVGGVFAMLVYGISVLGMPMLIDRDVDFVTAMLRSASSVLDSFGLYVAWGALVAVVTLVSMLPMFLGLFVTMPILGHATWHLYKRIASPD